MERALSRRARALGLALGALSAWGGTARATDAIVLKNGRVIEAERAWYEGNEVRYNKDGGIYGLPRTLVARVESPGGAGGNVDPDVVRSRERLLAQDPGEALRYARLALFRDARSVPALQALAAAQLALGDPRRARESLEQALRQDGDNPGTRALLGDALAATGERRRAEQEYARSLALKADPEVERKRKALALPVAGAAEVPFRIRYEGSVNEPVGMAVLKILTETHAEYRNRFGFHPDQPITVVLQTGASLRDTTRTPEWAEGWNDGTIQVPVLGLDALNPRLLRVLRHELAHSFVASRTGNNCPTWLQEGIAQWLEGGDPGRDDLTLSPLARTGRLPNLLTLEGPFRNLSEAEATNAYATSLAAVAHILRTRGEAGLLRLVAALSDRLPSEEALPVSLALSYAELQQTLENHLRALDGKAAAARAGVSP